MGTKGGVLFMAVGWILVGALVWGVGSFGIARGLEDRCLLVADGRGYGASTQTSSVWPPRFTCELSGPDGTSGTGAVDVSQPAVALLRSGWTLGFPIAWLVLGAVVRVRQTSRDDFLPAG
ncbi:MAG: hypothetical protein MUF33_13855 [Candidatus Nanopelagicales bacterium]|jgi:hypothetical protein|nr:hypothetical protein [Candidatus Nanopelagicales bacterium]MCU0299585.1 hypothetical protein [Candidatus Nanopelagicales bacterium]